MGRAANRRYFCGVLWFVLSLAACQINDVAMKILSIRLDPIQTTFLRFICAVLVLLPFLVAAGPASFRTTRPLLHLFRGGTLFAATACWCAGLRHAAMPMAVLIGFSMPLILLVFARIFLKERVSTWRWAATAIGFCGIAIAVGPAGPTAFRWATVPLLLSATFFAALDVLNRRYAREESLWAMIFYGSLWTAIFSAWPAIGRWVPPSTFEWLLAILLGVGANVLLYCLIRALRLIEASATAPYRNVEFLFSLLTGYIFFGEVVGQSTMLGAAIVIPVTLALACHEARSGGGAETEHFHSCC
ncbi:MAG: DMT family transporter [Puniceicoccales bacterium]|jgi:drug/metabolite transporter (DMT)-like permease|nr:DMT family transporter [Puniceicoccales bacterium]